MASMAVVVLCGSLPLVWHLVFIQKVRHVTCLYICHQTDASGVGATGTRRTCMEGMEYLAPEFLVACLTLVHFGCHH